MSAKENYKTDTGRQSELPLSSQRGMLDDIDEVYRALDSELSQLDSSGSSKKVVLPGYASTLALDTSTDACLGRSTVEKINPQSFSNVEDLARGNVSQTDLEQDKAATSSSRSFCAEEAFADEQIEHYSTWVSVSECEQWHLKVFQPSFISDAPDQVASVDGYEESLTNDLDALLIRMRSVVDSMGQRTVLMLPGEFGTGRSFYGMKRRNGALKGTGLAWTMARAGYQVFVVDHNVGQLKVAPDATKSGFFTGRAWAGRLSAFCSKFSSRIEESALVQQQLPAVMRACADKIRANSEGQFVSLLRQLNHSLSNAQLSADQRQTLLTEVDLLQQSFLEVKSSVDCPAVWIGHGFSSALLAACYARLGEAASGLRRCVFFGGRRQWTGGSYYSRILRKLLSSKLVNKLVGFGGYFPAKALALGPTNMGASQFALFSNWIADKQWLDPSDGFDYGATLARISTPATLHIMNETELGLVSAQDVRKFANELNSTRANLIGIPGSLGQIGHSEIPDEASAEMQPPRFTHAGLLTEPSAEGWLFEPMLDWLDSSAGYQAATMQHVGDTAIQRQHNKFSSEPAYLGTLVPSMG